MSGSEAAAARQAVLRAREAGPEERDAEVELHDGVLRVEPGKAVHPVDGPLRASDANAWPTRASTESMPRERPRRASTRLPAA